MTQKSRRNEKTLTIRGEERSAVQIPDTIKNVTGGDASIQDLIVFDFMPPIIGEQFRTDPILCKQLFRHAPVSAPFMLTNTAYTLEGKRQLQSENITAALEAYKIALDSQTSFVGFISNMQDSALLTKEEKSHLQLGKNELGNAITKFLRESGAGVDLSAYTLWLEEVRKLKENWLHLNRTAYKTREYAKACWQIGMFDQAIWMAKDAAPEMVKEIKASQPP